MCLPDDRQRRHGPTEERPRRSATGFGRTLDTSQYTPCRTSVNTDHVADDRVDTTPIYIVATEVPSDDLADTEDRAAEETGDRTGDPCLAGRSPTSRSRRLGDFLEGRDSTALRGSPIALFRL